MPATRARPAASADRPLTRQSAMDLADRLRAREVTAREVVEAHIAAIEVVNPRLNAVVVKRYDAARAEAAEADRRLAAGTDLPPLLGVPCTIKEAFAFGGLPNTSGLVSRQGLTALADAPTVARLRAAGAIPLGLTNVSELCMWYESDNRVYGRTNNAYDRTRIAGGSSGGEGAILGAGTVPFGLGADVGGSIRMPATFNGIFGHKPSPGLVPNTGQHPQAYGVSGRILGTGPMCRHAGDLMPLLRLLAGPDGADENCVETPLGDPAAVSLQGLPVLIVEGNGLIGVEPQLVAALHRAGEALAALGARVRVGIIPGLWRTFDIWGAAMHAAGGPTFTEHLGGGTAIPRVRELAKFLAGRSAHTFPALMLAFFEKLPAWMPRRTRWLVEEGRRLRAEIIERMGDGVMLYPPFAGLAPRHHRPLLRPFDFVYTALANVLELPATAVPMGLAREGVPLGVQVMGRPGADHLTIRIAEELELACGGWVEPGTGDGADLRR